MNDRVEVFVTDGGEDFQLHALIFELARTDVMGSTINGDVVTTRHESRRQMLGEGFEPAVVGRNSPCPQNRDAHTIKLKREGKNDSHKTIEAVDKSRAEYLNRVSHDSSRAARL